MQRLLTRSYNENAFGGSTFIKMANLILRPLRHLIHIHTCLLHCMYAYHVIVPQVSADSTAYNTIHYVVDAVTVSALAIDGCLGHDNTRLVYCRDNLYKYIEDNEFITLDSTVSHHNIINIHYSS